MPETDAERKARWPGGDSQAIAFLQGKGYRLKKNFSWEKPTRFHSVTQEESDAIWYLIEEWDYSGIEQ